MVKMTEQRQLDDKAETLERPFFSVVVPVYNKGAYVARAINSILAQTFTNFELLIVCDPSTDNSDEEVAKFTDPRIRVFHRDDPGPGGYAARNLGVKYARADWVAFLDADDEWHPERLQKSYELHKEFPEAKFLSHARVASENDEINHNEPINDKNFFINFKQYIELCLKNKRPVGTNSVTLNKSWSDNYTWFPEGRAKRSGDLYLWVFAIANTRGVAWSKHVGSISYRDVIGVSRTAIPSVNLNIEMVHELAFLLNKEELSYLKKYANRLIKTAWFEGRKAEKKDKALLWYFYYKDDLRFALFWAFLSLLPDSLINQLRKIKQLLYNRQ